MKNQEKNYYNLSGQLLKLSTSIFIGYQPKFFSLLQNGIKIGYRNLNETDFKQENIFLIKEVVVCQAEEEYSFTLQTPRRVFTLKANDQEMKVKWMRTITKIRKEIIRKKFKTNLHMTQKEMPLHMTFNNKSPQKPEQKKQKSPSKNQQSTSSYKPKILPSSTQNTLPNGSLSFLHQTHRSIKSNQIQTQRSIRMSMNPLPNFEKDSQIKKDYLQLLKNIPQQFVKYNIHITTLKNKVENLFTSSFNSYTYILISSKSLYPSEEGSLLEENLTNLILPEWAEVNKIYKMGALSSSNNSGTNTSISINSSPLKQPSSTHFPKLFLQISKIIDIQQSPSLQQKTCLKIRTSQNLHTLYSQTVQQKQRLKKILTFAITNYKQSFINNKLTKKNYDKLVYKYNNQYDQFLLLTKQMVNKFIPNNHHYQPQVVIKFIDIVIPFIQEFLLILENKKQNCSPVVLHVLKQIHEQVKIHIKLTWDTSHSVMKTQHVLKFLNALSAYHSIIKTYIQDQQYLSGMKELSKIYVRQSWKNFEDIILGIVEQEKRNNLFKDDDNEYIETNAVIDLFKFIYQVYDLATPCWDHKLHIHNVQKLMARAIQVYIKQLKADVDEAVISNKQLIAIANNYFRFSLTVDQFYTQKFSILQQKTKQNYDKLKVQYKELSNIILDKLAFDVRSLIKKYFQKLGFYKIEISKIYQLLKQSVENLELHLLHPLFTKRFYQKLFTTIRQSILLVLQKQISSKKKHNIPKLLQFLDNLSYDLVDISKLLYTGRTKIDKQLNQVNILLSDQNHNEIIKLIKGAEEDIRKIYVSLINLREDYYVGGPLYYMVNEDGIEKGSVVGNGKGTTTMRLTVALQRDMRASFSSYYMNQDADMLSSYDKSQTDSYYNNHHHMQQPLKLISQGYLLKCKINNKKIWQKQYFRLKNGTLYFYQNQKSQKSQNSIPLTQINKISISSEHQTLSFVICYVSLNREKEIYFKCENIELRDRWLESIGLELKRIKNQEKVRKQKLKLKENKKNNFIIDYQELNNGKGYFSYTGVGG